MRVKHVDRWKLWQYFVWLLVALSLTIFGASAIIRPLPLDGWWPALAVVVYAVVVNTVAALIAIRLWGFPKDRLLGR